MKQRLFQELNLLLIALTFLTRIPLTRWLVFDKKSLSQSSRYFPLIGLLVGAFGWLLFSLALLLFPIPLALLLSMVATVLLTGAFHEDGFADLCDGFGGGWEREQVLRIMKDSRLGTYGALGLGLMLAVKFAALLSLPLAWIGPGILVGHSLSRLLSTSYLFNYDYVQDAEASKVKPLATSLSTKALLFSAVTVIPAVLLLPFKLTLVLLAVLLLLRYLFGSYLNYRIGGYTGDCLGAAQQLAEVACYLSLVAYLG